MLKQTVIALAGPALLLGACTEKTITPEQAVAFKACVTKQAKLSDELSLNVTRLTSKPGETALTVTYKGQPVITYAAQPNSFPIVEITDFGKKESEAATVKDPRPNFTYYSRTLKEAVPNCTKG